MNKHNCLSWIARGLVKCNKLEIFLIFITGYFVIDSVRRRSVFQPYEEVHDLPPKLSDAALPSTANRSFFGATAPHHDVVFLPPTSRQTSQPHNQKVFLPPYPGQPSPQPNNQKVFLPPNPAQRPLVVAPSPHPLPSPSPKRNLPTAHPFSSLGAPTLSPRAPSSLLGSPSQRPAHSYLSSPSSPHPGGATTVLVLGYQRCGSSLMGLLFNANPHAFFLFEPADGVYGAMYGTADGWSVPTDIFNFQNQSYRVIPAVESEAVSATLINLLSCNMRAVPTEVLTHSFLGSWTKRQAKVRPYLGCLLKHKVKLGQCKRLVKDLCPTRFGRDLERSWRCRTLMWDVRAHPADYNMTRLPQVLRRYRSTHSKLTLLGLPITEAVARFHAYHECQYNVTRRLEPCYSALEEQCQQSSVRSVKTVRVTMDTAMRMLGTLPGLRVVHVMRDPRAVALSRLKQASFRGLRSGKDVVKEAALYCQRAYDDILKSKRLTQRFPGSMHRIIYEELSEQPLVKMRELYDFIGRPVPGEVEQWVYRNTQEARNSSSISHSWRSQISPEVARNIDAVCKDLNAEVGDVWPESPAPT